MSHEEALDWIRKETARRRREESGGGLVELRQPEAFSDEYAPAERLTRVRPGADPTETGPDSRIVRGLLCGACAGWGRPPTSAELYDAISNDANAPVTGPFSIAITFSQPVTGFELEDLVVPNGSASEPQGNDATYTATITPEASGTVTVDIPAGAAQDSAGNHSAAADQFSIVADLAPMSGSFTDDPLQPRVTPVKAVHFTELRTRIDALRGSGRPGAVLLDGPDSEGGGNAGQALASCWSSGRRWPQRIPRRGGRRHPWTDTAAVGGMTPIRAVHLMEQVTLIGQASADHDRVAQRKPLITRDLINYVYPVDPPYRDHMWDLENLLGKRNRMNLSRFHTFRRNPPNPL